MKAIVQRVASASVTINSSEKRSIGRGLVILLGIGQDDTEAGAAWLSEKILNLRIFPDENGKFDRSLLDIRGEILIVSQFTLFGDCQRGRRPDFSKAARPEKAIPLYERFVRLMKDSSLAVRTGEFGADMMVEILNDGPVTIALDTPTEK